MKFSLSKTTFTVFKYTNCINITGESPTKTAPDFYKTKPMTAMSFERLDDSPKQRERFSRRVRGLHVEEDRKIEEVEKRWNRSRSAENSPTRKSKESSPVCRTRRSLEIKLEKVSAKTPVDLKKAMSKSNTNRSAGSTKSKKREVWTYKKRRRRSKLRFASSYTSESKQSNEIDIETLDDSSDGNDGEEPGCSTYSDSYHVQLSQSSPRERSAPSPRSRQDYDISPLSAAVSPGRLHAAAISPRLNSAAVSTRHGPLHVDTDVLLMQVDDEQPSPTLSSGKRPPTPHGPLDRQLSNSSDKHSSKSPRSHGNPPMLEPEVLPHPSTPKQGPPTSPKLVPVNAEIDSGISSNGDSVDSLEHAKQLAAKVGAWKVLLKCVNVVI